MGFDITRVLDEPQVRTPLLMCLLHQINSSVDGRRLVIDIDEFWKALGDEAFRGLAQDGLKTYRKQNAFLILATQSPADVLRSPIAHTLLEQCPNKIYLPNPLASAAGYDDGFGQVDLVGALLQQDLPAQSAGERGGLCRRVWSDGEGVPPGARGDGAWRPPVPDQAGARLHRRQPPPRWHGRRDRRPLGTG